MHPITVPSVWSPNPHILPTTATCTLSLAGPRFLRRRQPHWLPVIDKSLLVKAPPYLSSLVTIAAPTRSTRSSRYISLISPKANTSFGRLFFQFSAANDWNELQKSLELETHISLTSFKHQLLEQLTITAPVHSPSVNSPSIYLIPKLYLFIYLVPLHPSISTYTFLF